MILSLTNFILSLVHIYNKLDILRLICMYTLYLLQNVLHIILDHIHTRQCHIIKSTIEKHVIENINKWHAWHLNVMFYTFRSMAAQWCIILQRKFVSFIAIWDVLSQTNLFNPVNTSCSLWCIGGCQRYGLLISCSPYISHSPVKRHSLS